MADTPTTSPSPRTTLDQLREEARQKEAAVKTIQEKSNEPAQPFWTPKEALALSFSILVFGLLVLLLMSTLVARFNVNINRILRAFALVLIIVAAVFLIVAGYTEQQIAPVMGLLGTIAGYLLGSRHSSGETGETDKGDGPSPPPGGPGPTAPKPSGPSAPTGPGEPPPPVPAPPAAKDAGAKPAESSASDAGSRVDESADTKKTGQENSSDQTDTTQVAS